MLTLPLVAAATGLLVVLAFMDSALGQATLLAESPHLIAVVGWVLLTVLARCAAQEPSGRVGRPARATTS